MTINITLDLTNAGNDTLKLSAKLLNYNKINNVVAAEETEIRRKKDFRIRSDASSSFYQLEKVGRTINHTFNVSALFPREMIISLLINFLFSSR